MFARTILLSTICLQFAGAAPADPTPNYLVRNGRPEAVLVVDSNAGPFYRFLAAELNRYVVSITGAKLEITTSTRPGAVNILLGGPNASRTVKEAADQGLVDFSHLKADGFLLWNARLHDRNVLIVGGDDEASTMYAVYDLVTRFGVTFLLARDILPGHRTDLVLPPLQVRAETPFPRRGLLISNIYPNRAIWNLAEVKSFLDQMAKLKMNYLQFFWFAHEPWIDYSYRGEHKLLGDATGKDSGYLMWRYNYGSYLVKDLTVGRNLFGGRKRMAPMEFQNVQNPADGYRVAKQFLNEVIRYAKTRHIKVWLCIDPTTLSGNLARYGTRATNLQLPFHPILGTHMCPADPVLHEINANRLKALVDTYPGAEGYFLYIPEMYPNCPDERDRALFTSRREEFAGLLKLWTPYTSYERNPEVVLNSNIGSLYIVQKLLEARDRIAPQAKIGIGGIGRGYVLPFMDKRFPKSVPFTDMESRAIWTPNGVPMQDFGGMGERERTLIPRIDDDSDMFGMQFNVNLYYKDRVLEGSLENGVAGFAGQLNRARGTEQNYLYLAEGAWHPHLTPTQFYAEYSRRVFGKKAAPAMMAAFRKLEENEEYLGWTGRGNFGCCGVIPEVAQAYHLYNQPNPFDGPNDWSGFLRTSNDKVRAFSHSIELLGGALQDLRNASDTVAPQGKHELQYLENKTESYALLLKTLITAREGYIAFDEAFRLRNQIGRDEFVKKLDASMDLFTEARKLGRKTTEKFAEVVDHPSDLGVLYRANLFLVTGLELVEQTMRDIDNFHHGRPYTNRVAWDKIYYGFPQFAPRF